jgi:hypothetical protein
VVPAYACHTVYLKMNGGGILKNPWGMCMCMYKVYMYALFSNIVMLYCTERLCVVESVIIFHTI